LPFPPPSACSNYLRTDNTITPRCRQGTATRTPTGGQRGLQTCSCTSPSTRPHIDQIHGLELCSHTHYPEADVHSTSLSTHEPLAHPTPTASRPRCSSIRPLSATLRYSDCMLSWRTRVAMPTFSLRRHVTLIRTAVTNLRRGQLPRCERPCSHRLLLLRGHDVGRPLRLPLDRPNVVVRGEVEDHRAGALVDPPVAHQPSLSAV